MSEPSDPRSPPAVGAVTDGAPARPPGALRRLVIAVMFGAVSAWASELSVQGYETRLQSAEQRHVLEQASALRARLEGALNSTVYLTQGLVAYIASVGTLSELQVTRALKAVHDADPRIRAIGLAPDNTLRYFYPLVGDESSLGLGYADHPEQWPAVQRAMETHQSVLYGPIDLVEGGLALIDRTPVFLDDHRYWGLVSMVIDLPKLLASAGLESRIEGIRYWLKADPGLAGHDGEVIGQGPRPADALILPIQVPGGRWQLAARPDAGWQGSHQHLTALRLLLYALSALLGLAALSIMNGRALAHALVRQLGRVNRELQVANSKLRHLSQIDELTGLANRRAFEERYDLTWQLCSRYQLRLSVLMIDADHFKSINDRFGHAEGDRALVALTDALSRGIRRRGDLLARWGGEEFVFFSAGLGPEASMTLADRLRQGVQDRVATPDGQPVTISIGVATTVPARDDLPSALLEAADRALYEAKRAGRNQVHLAS